MEVDTADAEAVADIGISERVVAHPEDGVGMGFEIAVSDVREDEEEFEVKASAADTREIVVDPLVIGDSSESFRGGIPDLEDTIYDIVNYMSKEYLKVQAMLSIERDHINSIHWHMALSQEEFCQVCRDRDDTRRRLRRLESYVERNLEALAAHEATRAANALEAENQIQNGNDGDNGNGGNGDGENGNGKNGNGGNGNPNENGRGDRHLMKLMTEVYCPRNEIQKMETKLWNLTVKNNDLAAYTQRFQELTMMCSKMVPEEEDRVEKFIGGLSDNIQGNVIAVEPTRLQDAIRIASNLMHQKLKGGQNVARAYMAGNNEKKPYNGRLPLCNKCQLHHEGPCIVRCGKYNKVGHLTRDSRNKNGVGEARGKAYVLGGGDDNPNSNVVKGTFLLNNHYAFILFDSGADRSFVSTTFSTLLDITLDTLDVSYAVELADGRISETNTVLRGCMLGLFGHPFNIDLMPVELGSFDAIIGMDWLAYHHAVIVCNEKVVRIPYGDEVLIVQGDGGSRREKSKLSIISCTKTHKYVEKGCQIFLAQVTKKETKGKSEEKRLEVVLSILDFSEVFPEDLPGLPPTRQVQFQIDLVPSAALVARAPYRLAPTELQELSTQLQELSDKGFIRPSSSSWGAPEDIPKTAFRTRYGHYEFQVMSFWTDQSTGSIHGSDESGFSKIAKPMTKLTQKNVKFDWSKKAESAFQLLNQKLCSSPILALPEGSENFVVYCDASRKGLGAVLMQREKRHYLYGTKCVVFTDHKSLQHILDQKELNMRQHRWLELLSDYDCKIRYHSGKANVILEVQVEARKEENYETEDLCDLKKAVLRARIMKAEIATYETDSLEEVDERTILERGSCLEDLMLWSSERTIQTLEDMLRACVMDFRKGWDRHLPLVEFSYNNSYHTSIKVAPFEALYGQKCRSPICWAEVGDAKLTGPEIVHETTEKIVQIKKRIQASEIGRRAMPIGGVCH
ncbi:putative reverse transcriptase domain-containing protein [Tanacetum coccineum]|uniref:Reverse transcriptase domain-containing protein n=1 Tax=Tanacetum coccineum TaxID=301880 RepID=A0ABQ4YI22_9ASTR